MDRFIVESIIISIVIAGAVAIIMMAVEGCEAESLEAPWACLDGSFRP